VKFLLLALHQGFQAGVLPVESAPLRVGQVDRRRHEYAIIRDTPQHQIAFGAAKPDLPGPNRTAEILDPDQIFLLRQPKNIRQPHRNYH
jgi:hypothetical protein